MKGFMINIVGIALWFLTLVIGGCIIALLEKCGINTSWLYFLLGGVSTSLLCNSIMVIRDEDEE